MAIEVIEDLVAGNTGTNTIRKGWEFTRVFKVSGVTGTGHKKVKTAAAQPGMPQIGDPHPDEVNSIVKQVVCVSESSEVLELQVIYAPPDFFTPTTDQVVINVGSTLSQVDTNLDINGNVLQAEYTYPSDYSETPEFQGKTYFHGAMVPKLIPESTRVFTIKEEEDPGIKASIYVGRINLFAIYGGNPGTWMCTGIEGSSQDGGRTFQVTYSFQFRIDGWLTDVVFISSDTGEPPVFANAAEVAAGIQTYQIYESIDFGQLNLS